MKVKSPTSDTVERTTTDEAGDSIQYIGMAQAAKISPGRPSASTPWRWAKKGVGGIHLQHIRVGGRVLTTPEWVEEFIAACNQTAAERAESELIDDGC